MSRVTQSQPRVNPHITVIRDGRLFRWRRFDGRIGRVSTSAWTDAAAAVVVAKSVASCYGVRFEGVQHGYSL